MGESELCKYRRLTRLEIVLAMSVLSNGIFRSADLNGVERGGMLCRTFCREEDTGLEFVLG